MSETFTPEEQELIAAIERAFDEETFLELAGGGRHASTQHSSRSLEQMIERLFQEGKTGATFADTQEMCASIEWILLQDTGAKRAFLDRWEQAEEGEDIVVSGRVPRLQAATLALDRHAALEYGTTSDVCAVFRKSAQAPAGQDNAFGMQLISCYPLASGATHVADPRIPEILRSTTTYRKGSPARRLSMELALHPVSGQRSVTYDAYRQRAQVVLADHDLDRVITADAEGVRMDTYEVTRTGEVLRCLEEGRDMSEPSALRPYLADGGPLGPALLDISSTFAQVKKTPVLSGARPEHAPLTGEPVRRIAREASQDEKPEFVDERPDMLAEEEPEQKRGSQSRGRPYSHYTKR